MIRKRQVIAAVATAVLGGAVWAAVDGGRGGSAGRPTEYVEDGTGRGADEGAAGARRGGAAGEAAGAAGREGAAGEAAGARRGGADDNAPGLPEGVVPNLQEIAAMTRLYGAVSSGDKEEIASVLLEGGDVFSRLFYETFGGERYRYDGNGFSSELSGEGLVLTGAANVFYGSFGEKGPEGACTALQAVLIDEPRYDYSEGTWKDGKLSGSGASGYRYYEDVPEGESRSVLREGNFVGDRMDGTVTYVNTGSDGETARWTMEVEDGVIRPDERWVKDPQSGVYRLAADDNPAYAYAVSEEEMEAPRWVNILVWNADN